MVTNSAERKYIRTLMRREQQLQKRLRERLGTPQSLDYDRAEKAALNWVLQIIGTGKNSDEINEANCT